MKTQIKLAFAVFMAFVATAAFATPTYTGGTVADFDSNCHEGTMSCPTPAPTDASVAGYWIWTTGDGNWSIRWTGGTDDPETAAVENTPVYTFKGKITLDIGTLDDAPVTVAWDSNDGSVVVSNDAFSEEWISYTDAYATYGWDGIDFNLGNYTGDIEFDLWSDLWDDLFDNECESGCVAEGAYIYVGDGNSVGTIEVRPAPWGNYSGRIQSFEISVPEPGTLALLGLGLMGMGMSRRKAKA